MENGYVVRGVPRSIAQDAWWFASETLAPGNSGRHSRDNRHISVGPAGQHLAALLAVLIAGDFLIYGHAPGLSLALFAWVLFLAAVHDMLRRNMPFGPAILLVFAALPMVEYVQALSVAFLVAGVFVSVAWARLGSHSIHDILAGAGRLATHIPTFAPRDAIAASTLLRGRAGDRIDATRFVREWALPLGGVLILSGLLSEANPILAGWISDVFTWDLNAVELVLRVTFWCGLAILAWPLMRVPASDLSGSGTSFQMRGASLFWINAGSVHKALVVFNVVMAVQTALDVRYLWAGASLPEGLSYASYARRGAYPLVATALLAGAFALAARPFLQERRGLRALVILWIAQNVLLASAAAFRLWLYVDAYGLTYLRLHAGIWMCMVAIGLALIGWQIWRERSNSWLIFRCGALGIGVLYACAFVNFAQIIASHNLTLARTDTYYLCRLGPTAAPALARTQRVLPCDVNAPVTEGWRDWGFRKWRVSSYLNRAAAPEPTNENTRRR
ncbi:DUF4153 domain-containing protein [Arenibacterium sp. CAU 1754]